MHPISRMAYRAKPEVEHVLHRHADALLARLPGQTTPGHGTSPPAAMALANAPAAKQRNVFDYLLGSLCEVRVFKPDVD